MSAKQSGPPAEFIQACADYSLVLEDREIALLEHYLRSLLEANRQFNLTAIREPDVAWMRHIFDSLTLLPFVLEIAPDRAIDIGTGGGVPGIPLAICTPDVQWALLDATTKKARFVETVVGDLGLSNVRVLNQRSETAGAHGSPERAAFELVVTRAVGSLSVLLELSVPFATIGGFVFAIKGERSAGEIDEAKGALHQLHAHVTGTHQTPTGTIVIIEKQRKTPRKYPRRPGEPKRSPLT